MAAYLDTSALAKIYHQEIGSGFVEELVVRDPSVFLSRLGSLELQSVLAGKIRMQVVAQADSDLAAQRFRSDVRRRRFRIVAVRVRHYEFAEALIATHGARFSLLTLDALHWLLHWTFTGIA